MNNFKSFILLLALLFSVFAQTIYCSTELCESERGDVACKNNGKIHSFFKNCTLIKITEELRIEIVNTHNYLRNLIAQGFFIFSKAERMGAVVWSNELAKLAENNAEDCQIVYDNLYTNRNRLTGQNRASDEWLRWKNLSVSEAVNYQIHGWFNRYLYYREDNFTFEWYNLKSFITMVQDKSTHIGCAIRIFDKDGIRRQLLTCNYERIYNKSLLDPAYGRGPTASKCTSGTHYKFTSLCSTRERYY